VILSPRWPPGEDLSFATGQFEIVVQAHASSRICNGKPFCLPIFFVLFELLQKNHVRDQIHPLKVPNASFFSTNRQEPTFERSHHQLPIAATCYYKPGLPAL
jgi:hypothetical protein